MRIGILSQWFDPETGPAALPGVYAREFVRLGHDVKVLTGFPNYPEGSLYPGYRMRLRQRERADGVQVTRVPLYPNHSRSSFGRIANYSSFSLSSAFLGAGALSGIDGLWVYNSPVSVVLPQLLHSRFGRIPVFLHVQDLWPDTLLMSGLVPEGRGARLASRAISAIVRLMENRSAVIGVISPSVKELLLTRNPKLDPERIVFAPNPANESLFRPADVIRRELGLQSSDNGIVDFMYAGAIGDVQGLDTLIDAATILRDRTDMRISLVGDGISRERLEARARQRGLTHVHFVGRVPQYAVPELMARADVQLVSLGAREFLRYTTPSKIPAIMASSLPMVAQIDGDGASAIRQSKSGLVTPPGDAEALAAALIEMISLGHEARTAMGAAGKEYYSRTFSAKAAAQLITSHMAP